MNEPTTAAALGYDDRYALAIAALQTRLDERGLLTDSDVLDIAEDFTIDNLADETSEPVGDYERLRDDLYDAVEWDG